VKKYLAHKVALKSLSASPKLRVSLMKLKAKKISEIASEVSVDENVLKEYNKW